MKKIASVLAIALALTATSVPQQAQAKDVLPVIGDIAIAGLLILDVAALAACAANEDCVYVDYSTNCRYREIHTDEQRVACGRDGYWSGYRCAQIREHTDRYIEVCD